ncbi:hypothetical protein CYMTET_30420 [Cymbomonas tetramitiformis]|uniref:Uncharacterized protein n=1 Tax=Cymbomonas tetramitiformis TaxID=36881 RepID=A0AAE0FIV6_9CHLO|nr:hypothetical protein CYMTET_30420 [Cymbomonas tetramitiformis]
MLAFEDHGKNRAGMQCTGPWQCTGRLNAAGESTDPTPVCPPQQPRRGSRPGPESRGAECKIRCHAKLRAEVGEDREVEAEVEAGAEAGAGAEAEAEAEVEADAQAEAEA